MKTITIYGSGCANCKQTESIIRQVISTHHIADIEVTKVTEIQDIVAAGVLSTPAVSVDGTIMSSGRIPRSDEVQQWLLADKAEK
jgi:small redox-active disulfide protein 2